MAGIAAWEREIMLERQREGIAKAKAEGKYKGRAPTARKHAAEAQAMRQQGISATVIAKQLGINRASAYRIMAFAVGVCGMTPVAGSDRRRRARAADIQG